MGHRDDLLDGERADAAIRRVLARLDEPAALAPPPDLVTRTARRLPGVPPAAAARSAARRAALRAGLRLAVMGVLILVAGLGIWGAVGGQPLALLLGDGTGGLSRALLTLQLLSKPLLHTVGGLGGPLLAAGALALAGAGWLWSMLLRRTLVQYSEQAP